MDSEDFFDFARGFAAVALVVIVTTIATFCLVKIGSGMFDNPSKLGALEQASINLCDKAHGTVVLEDNGQAYKSCAINGHSDTKNIVSENK